MKGIGGPVSPLAGLAAVPLTPLVRPQSDISSQIYHRPVHQSLVQIRLTTLLSRKALPKNAAVVIANGLTIHRQAVSSATRDGNALAHQLLGIEPSGYFEADKLSALVEQTPAKAQHVALAIVLAACESVTSKQTWRSPVLPMRTISPSSPGGGISSATSRESSPATPRTWSLRPSEPRPTENQLGSRH